MPFLLSGRQASFVWRRGAILHFNKDVHASPGHQQIRASIPHLCQRLHGCACLAQRIDYLWMVSINAPAVSAPDHLKVTVMSGGYRKFSSHSGVLLGPQINPESLMMRRRGQPNLSQ